MSPQGEETQRRWQRSAIDAPQALQQILKLGGLRRDAFISRDLDAWRLLSWKSPVRWHGPAGQAGGTQRDPAERRDKDRNRRSPAQKMID